MRTGFQQPVPTVLIAPASEHNRQLATAYAAMSGIHRDLAMHTWDPEVPVDLGGALVRARTVQESLEAAVRAGSPVTKPVWGPDDVARTLAQAVADGARQAAEAVRLLAAPGTSLDAIRGAAGILHSLVSQATHQVARYSWDLPADSVVFWTRTHSS